MGLTPHTFYSMTRAEFILTMVGFERKQAKKWEHTRLIAYTVASTVRSKQKIKKITDWLPLSIDAERKQTFEADEMREKWQKLKANESNVKG